MSYLEYKLNKKHFSKKYTLNGSQAYEMWHLYYYIKQIQSADLGTLNKKFIKILSSKYFILIIFFQIIKVKKFLELGSSLFESIAGLEFLNKKYRLNLKLKSIKFFGIEISSLFNYVSKKIFRDYKISHYSRVKYINTNFDLLYDRMSSSYAFTKEVQLAELINKSKITFCNLAVYKDFAPPSQKKSPVNILGKTFGGRFKIFNLDLLNNLIKKNGYHIFGKIHPNNKNITFNKQLRIYRLDGFFVFCNELIIKKFLFLIGNSRYKFSKKIKATPIKDLNKNFFYFYSN